MLSVNYGEIIYKPFCAECHYAECRYAECHYAECRYAECHYAECHRADLANSSFFRQIRTVDCVLVRPAGTTETIPENLCSDSGLVAPAAVQECGLGDCPKWQSAEWQSCKEAKCIAKNTGKNVLTTRTADTYSVFFCVLTVKEDIHFRFLLPISH